MTCYGIYRSLICLLCRASSSADRASKDQAQILEALNEIHRDHQNGLIAEPALSRVTVDDLYESNEDTWSGLAEDLSRKNVSRVTLDQNVPFVREWIEQVILAQVIEENAVAEDYVSESPPSFPQENSSLGK